MYFAGKSRVWVDSLTYKMMFMIHVPCDTTYGMTMMCENVVKLTCPSKKKHHFFKGLGVSFVRLYDVIQFTSTHELMQMNVHIQDRLYNTVEIVVTVVTEHLVRRKPFPKRNDTCTPKPAHPMHDCSIEYRIDVQPVLFLEGLPSRKLTHPTLAIEHHLQKYLGNTICQFPEAYFCIVNCVLMTNLDLHAQPVSYKIKTLSQFWVDDFLFPFRCYMWRFPGG